MDSETFWNLTWWDWNLWVERIMEQRKEKKLEQEYEWERLSWLLAKINNFARGKNDPVSIPTDIFKPSWYKEESNQGKKLSLKEVRKNLGSKFIKDG